MIWGRWLVFRTPVATGVGERIGRYYRRPAAWRAVQKMRRAEPRPAVFLYEVADARALR